MIVRCTARLFKLLAPSEVVNVAPAPDDWYANLIWIERRKCLLMVHADTLFSMFVADVRKPQLSKFGDYLAGAAAAAAALADEGLAPDCLGPLDLSQRDSAFSAFSGLTGMKYRTRARLREASPAQLPNESLRGVATVVITSGTGRTRALGAAITADWAPRWPVLGPTPNGPSGSQTWSACPPRRGFQPRLLGVHASAIIGRCL